MSIDPVHLRSAGFILALAIAGSTACMSTWGFDPPPAGQDSDAGSEGEDTSMEREPASYQALDCLGTPAEQGTAVPSSCEGGQVLYQVGTEVFRSTLDGGVSTENLSECLDQHWPGSDQWMTPSGDGSWLLMVTDRFHAECSDWSCLAVIRADLSEAEIVKVGGAPLHVDQHGAIASDGQLVIYPDTEGPHVFDLYALGRTVEDWGTPLLLTAESPYSYNLQPSLSADGRKLVFDCGEDPYSQPPTSICEVNTDGSGFRVVWTPEQGGVGVEGRPDAALHHPTYSPDGSILFESDWSGEQIWRLESSGLPTQVSSEYSNDNSPCALQNGCIVSLWLERPDSSGFHEMKIMDADGNSVSMLRTDVDVVDLGTGCGG